jgi:hypothetical protein
MRRMTKGGKAMRGRSIGIILLAIYLFLVGLVALGLSFGGTGLLIGLVAIAAGIFLLAGR